MTDVIQVMTTVDSKEGADRLARAAVEQRVAACAQVIGPIRSTYWWEGAVESAEEWLCILKSTQALYAQLEPAICAVHPYEVPEILAIPVTAGHSAYIAWLQRELSDRR